jgi:hypothetical protein
MNIALDSSLIEKMFVGWHKQAKEILTVKIISKSTNSEDSKQATYKDRSRDVYAYAIKNEFSLL